MLAAFDRTGGSLSLQKLTEMVDIKRGQLELMLKQLDVEGVLRRVGGQTFERTEQPWTYPTERVEGVTGARRNEQQLMFDYMATDRCRMQFLTSQLDDPAIAPCGVCDNCTGVPVDPTVDPALVTAADAYLRRRPLHIEPEEAGHQDRRAPRGRPGAVPVGRRRMGTAGRAGASRPDGSTTNSSAPCSRCSPSGDPTPTPSGSRRCRRRAAISIADFAARLADEIGLPYVDTRHPHRRATTAEVAPEQPPPEGERAAACSP